MESENIPCEVCKKMFSDRVSLTKHLHKHAENQSLMCLFCTKTFSDKRNLSRHLRIHTGEKPYACLVCKQEFSDTTNYKRHKMKCKVENLKSLLKDSPPLQVHEEDAAESLDHPASEENSKESQMSSLSDMHTCEIGITFPSKKTSTQEHGSQSSGTNNDDDDDSNTPQEDGHLSTHNKGKTLSCAFCGIWFRDSQNLQNHEKRHINGSMSHCNICEMYFNDKFSFQRHMEMHSSRFQTHAQVVDQKSPGGNDLQQIPNAIPSETNYFENNVDLDSGFSESEGKNTLRCSFCSKCYMNSNNLLKHLKYHNEKMQVSCQVCERGFANLQRHLLSHIGIKVEKGDMPSLSKKTLYSEVKNSPRKTANSNSELCCKKCGKILSSRYSLKRHLLTHLERKPWVCISCQLRFIDHSNLLKHQARCLVSKSSSKSIRRKVQILTKARRQQMKQNKNSKVKQKKNKTVRLNKK